MDRALVACRAVHFASAMLLFGAAAFPLYTMRRPRAADIDGFGLQRVLLAAAVLALLSALAMIPCVTATMAGSVAAAFDVKTLSVVLLDTGFGRAWRWHVLFAVMLVIAYCVRREIIAWRAALAALLLASLAWVGHAAADPGAIRFGHEANDAAHLLAAGLWLGGLLPLATLAWRVRGRSPARLAMLRHALPRFSQAGYLAVVLVALTGIVNALLLVGSIDGLTQTDYGRLLLA